MNKNQNGQNDTILHRGGCGIRPRFWVLALVLVFGGGLFFWREWGQLDSAHSPGTAAGKAPLPVTLSGCEETICAMSPPDVPCLAPEQGGVTDVSPPFLGEEEVFETEAENAEVERVRQWADNDVEVAARWAEAMLPGEARREALDAVAIKWAGQDPAGAVNWVSQWRGEFDRQKSLLNVAYEGARTEPEMMLSVAMEQPGEPEWDAMIEYAVMQWTAVAPERAVVWVDQNIAEPLRAQVLSRVATVWGDANPKTAALLAVEWIEPGRQQDDAVMGIVQRWAQTDPETTAKWVAEFPEGNLKQSASETMAWSGNDFGF